MHHRRAIAINAILYVVTFVLAAAILALRGDPLSYSTPPTQSQIMLAMIVGIVLTTFGAWWYFRKSPKSAKAGLLFGVIAILVGLALDLVASVGIWISGRDPFSFLADSYSFWFFGVMLAFVLVLTTVVGARRR